MALQGARALACRVRAARRKSSAMLPGYSCAPRSTAICKMAPIRARRLQTKNAGPEPRAYLYFPVLQPCGLGVVAGKLMGAPPTETGPTGLGCRAILLRATEDSRLRACPMVEVTSRDIAVCSESTFVMSLEIWADIFFTSSCSSVTCPDIFFTSTCSSVTLCLREASVIESC